MCLLPSNHPRNTTNNPQSIQISEIEFFLPTKEDNYQFLDGHSGRISRKKRKSGRVAAQ